jgi:hypothetical protein
VWVEPIEPNPADVHNRHQGHSGETLKVGELLGRI